MREINQSACIFVCLSISYLKRAIGSAAVLFLFFFFLVQITTASQIMNDSEKLQKYARVIN